MVYKKEFDGLRAIAVIAVIIYHLNTKYLPNGFLGVDIFLVLSGFLITSIIQEGLKERRFYILEFLKKRFFRIYPAYFTVICLTLIAGSMILSKSSWEILRSSAIYSFLGIPNFYYTKITESYFKINSMYPLLHLWSLGLELQFYLIWAITLLIANKLRINLRYLIIFLCLTSFAIATYFYSHTISFFLFGREFIIGKKFVFYLLPSRIWEFGIGSLAIFYMKRIHNIRINHLLAAIGIVMVLLALCFLKAQMSSPLIEHYFLV